MEKFKVGHFYETCDCGVDPVRIVRRTEKTIWVDNGTASWKMRIHTGHSGEYAVDSSVPKKWREMYTYMAAFERK